jgi:hypothetical protein
MNAFPVLLSIDPSANNLGWASCDLRTAGADPDIYRIKLWTSGVIHPQGLNIQERWHDAFEQLGAEMTKADQWPTHLVAEQPTFFGSIKGRIAAQQDHTIRLGQMVAGIAGLFKFPPSRIALYTANQWKGSVPKRVTKHRLQKAFPDVDASQLPDDEVDAVMLAVFWLTGYLRKLKGPPLDERHERIRAEFFSLAREARDKNSDTQAFHGRLSTLINRRGDWPRGLVRKWLQQLEIRPPQIRTIMRNSDSAFRGGGFFEVKSERAGGD